MKIGSAERAAGTGDSEKISDATVFWLIEPVQDVGTQHKIRGVLA